MPIVLVQDGKPVEPALRVEHMPLGEVLEAARQQGLEHLDDIRLAILEPSGKISIIRATPAPAEDTSAEDDSGRNPANPGVNPAS